MAEQKTYQLKFYRGTLGIPKHGINIHEKLCSKSIMLDSEIAVNNVDETFKFHEFDDDFLFGEIRKRRRDLPGITDSHTDKDLQLADGESLFETNQFLLVRKDNLLIYQVNAYGCALSRFEKALGLYAGNETASFAPVLAADAMADFIKGNEPVKSFSCSVAVPQNLDLYQHLDPFVRLDELVAGTGQINFRLSLGRGKKGFLQNLFANKHFKDTMELDVTSAHITDKNGNDINLLENQIVEKVSINKHETLKLMRNKIKSGLADAYEKRADAIHAMLSH